MMADLPEFTVQVEASAQLTVTPEYGEPRRATTDDLAGLGIHDAKALYWKFANALCQIVDVADTSELQGAANLVRYLAELTVHDGSLFTVDDAVHYFTKRDDDRAPDEPTDAEMLRAALAAPPDVVALARAVVDADDETGQALPKAVELAVEALRNALRQR